MSAKQSARSPRYKPLKAATEEEKALVVRSDFADDVAWAAICEAICQPVGDFQAHVDFLNDPVYAGITPAQLLAISPPDPRRTFIFMIDQTTLAHPDQPILCLDLHTERGRTFRVIPSEMWSVENNLSIANMDFAEFANAVDQAGIFRGFV